MAKSKKKASRAARKAAKAAGVPVEKPKASTSSGPRARPAEPAPITETFDREEVPAAPQPAASVTFKATKTRTDTGIDKRMSEVELPAIRKDLRKLALTVAFFGVIFAGLAVVGNNTDMVEELGKSLFSLWQ